jgi:hypothetical protein
MRVNVYHEEITTDVVVVSTRASTGNEYLGLRFFLESTPSLHRTARDDDRSAVTFWVGDKESAKRLLNAALAALDLV